MKYVTLSAIIAALAVSGAAAASALPEKEVMTVFKTPWCGCCDAWVDAMAAEGFAVTVRDLEDLSLVKRQAGVAPELEGCHTAVIETERKYVLEGHVPVAAIERLLDEKPDIGGLAVPGMPMGSTGMGDDPDARYQVMAFTGRSDETPTVFMTMGE